MANDLTGDFDVVAEFAIPAADRVLAAMHRSERFLHSLTLRVDDNPPPGSKVSKPTIVGSVDAFGDPTVNHTQIGRPIPLPGQLSATNPIYSLLDPVVNTGLLVATEGTIVPSHLQGRAQLQLAPPTLEVPDASGKNITVRMDIMARYFPDPHTSPLAEFVRGELQMTAAVDQVASQTANVVDIDIKAENVNVNFSKKFSSQPLSAEDLAGINLLIRNALKTSFLPSNATLPPTISYMQFKTLLGGPNAIAVLLNMQGARGDPGSFNSVFLGTGDDFAFAASAAYVENAFQPDLSQKYHYWVYTITLKNATIALQQGKIVVTVSGHAHSNRWWAPSFDFTIHQDFTLKPASMPPGGPLNTVELVPGEIGGGVTGWLLNLFGGNALDTVDQNAQDAVRHMFSADENLGGFLESLLTPPRPKLLPLPPQGPAFQLAYTSVAIQPSGIVLHGSLAVLNPPLGPEILSSEISPQGSVAPVPGWPPPHVEFEQIPANAGGGGGVHGAGGLILSGPDYSALKTWIPGGAIQRYEWSSQGQTQPFFTDDNKFVLIHPPPEIASGMVSSGVVAGHTRLCLTVRGLRLSSSGPVVAQPVSATVCGYTTVSLIQGLESALDGEFLMVALTQPGPRGLVEVAGHTSARLDGTSGNTPNRIVHFADEKTAGQLGLLMQALRQSKREDAATAVLAVLTPDQMAKARYTESVIYAEDQRGAWARLFGVKTTRRPVTLIVGPKGDVLWQHEGELDSETLAAALQKLLASGGSVRLRMLRLNLRIGQPPPNFLFEYAPGHELTLRKLAGRPIILVFWKSSSKPSLEAVRDLQKTTPTAGAQGPVVLAINDGEAPELARKVAADNGLSATVVTDPERKNLARLRREPLAHLRFHRRVRFDRGNPLRPSCRESTRVPLRARSCGLTLRNTVSCCRRENGTERSSLGEAVQAPEESAG